MEEIEKIADKYKVGDILAKEDAELVLKNALKNDKFTESKTLKKRLVH